VHTVTSAQGAVERVTIAGNRFYLVPGATEPYPSVTTVLSILNKSQLNAWAVRQASSALLERLQADPELLAKSRSNSAAAAELVTSACNSMASIGEEAASVGTTAHEAIDASMFADAAARLALRRTVTDPAVTNVLDSFELWERQSAVSFKHSEIVVWSHRHRFAGTIDAIGLLPTGAPIALDWKTSNALREVYALQLAAYALAWNEMNPSDAPVREGVVVRFDKKKVMFEARRVASMEESQAAFLSALNLWQWRTKAPFEAAVVTKHITKKASPK
jgi:hypothetical protein